MGLEAMLLRFQLLTQPGQLQREGLALQAHLLFCWMPT